MQHAHRVAYVLLQGCSYSWGCFSIDDASYHALLPRFHFPPPLPPQVQAALSLGVDLNNLYPKTELDLVDHAGHDIKRAKVLAIHYEKRRQDLIASVKEERARLMGGSRAASATVKPSASSAFSPIVTSRTAGATGGLAGTSRSAADTPTRVGSASASESGGGAAGLSQTDLLRSAAVQRERKRAEMQRAKQLADMEHTILHEIKRAEDAKAAAEAAAAVEADTEARRKAADAERKKQQEKRRAEEVARKEEADKRVEEMRRLAAEAFAKDAEKEKIQKAREAELLVKRKAEEAARAAAAEAADIEKAREFEAHQAELARRLAVAEAMDAEREAKRIAFQEKARAEAKVKAEAALKRLEAALLRDAAALEQKHKDFEAKVAEAEVRQKEKAMREAEVYKKRALKRANKEKKCVESFAKARQSEREWVEKLESRISKEEAALAKVRRETAVAHEAKVQAEMLATYDKQQARKELKRREEFTLIQNLWRMMDLEAKWEVEAAEKARIAKERQDYQRKMILMRSHADEEMERMRFLGSISAAKLEKLKKTLGGGSSGGGGGGEGGNTVAL